MILLDGEIGSGLSEICPSNKIQNAAMDKSLAIQTAITISKLGYIYLVINATVTGGEYFNVSLITIHQNATLIDLHNDVLEVLAPNPSYHLGALHSSHHTDIPRLLKGGVDIQFFRIG